MMLYSQEIGMEVLDVNIYLSCLDIIPFWENIFNLNFLGHGNVIMGGDMSFFSGNSVIFFFWGGGYSCGSILQLFDVSLVKIKSTWRNKMVGIRRI
jgi:hypothetical protein